MERILLIEDDQALGRGTALALAGEADSYVFFVSDQPRLRESTIGRQLECCRGSGAPLGCLSC